MSMARNTRQRWWNRVVMRKYAQFPQNYRFQIPKDCHWRDVRVGTTNVGQALQKARRGIEKVNPETLYGLFGDAA